MKGIRDMETQKKEEILLTNSLKEINKKILEEIPKAESSLKALPESMWEKEVNFEKFVQELMTQSPYRNTNYTELVDQFSDLEEQQVKETKEEPTNEKFEDFSF
ncbi:TPA: hypothetical protein ITS68_002475 [Enterococcus faecalis]|uniref:V-type ATPase subunit a family protein n=2 Tax=Enterococcus TaxID=1350 RepID=UPI00201A453B|nr:V-type ATPase subunit a family protein [Enterococcus faecalis]MCL4596043.1 V-type ATPase subunit a family protein [Enterococcus faecalis]HAP2865519.1 hypothetical protein [Enterococcus faecalis]HAP3008364.1 hypothetical protein [Enterococcus faecalis]